MLTRPVNNNPHRNNPPSSTQKQTYVNKTESTRIQPRRPRRDQTTSFPCDTTWQTPNIIYSSPFVTYESVAVLTDGFNLNEHIDLKKIRPESTLSGWFQPATPVYHYHHHNPGVNRTVGTIPSSEPPAKGRKYSVAPFFMLENNGGQHYNGHYHHYHNHNYHYSNPNHYHHGSGNQHGVNRKTLLSSQQPPPPTQAGQNSAGYAVPFIPASLSFDQAIVSVSTSSQAGGKVSFKNG